VLTFLSLFSFSLWGKLGVCFKTQDSLQASRRSGMGVGIGVGVGEGLVDSHVLGSLV
jgi:hypothetical protein